MSWIQNLTVRSKVISAFATVLVVTAMLGAFAINRLSVVNDGASRLADSYLAGTIGLGDFRYAATRYRQFQASALLMTILEDKASEEKKAQAALEDAGKGWDAYATTIEPGIEQELANKVKSTWQDYVAMNEKLAQLSHAAKNEEATALYTGEMRAVFNKFQDALQEDKVYQVKGSKTETQRIADTYSNSRILILVGLGLAGALCLIAGWMIVTGVSIPIRAMTVAMNRLAQHDLATEVHGLER